MKPLKIAVAGLGTVGVGVVRLLQENAAEIEARGGRPVQLVAVSAKNKNKDRGLDLSNSIWIDNPVEIANTEADVVVELMGGENGAAYDLVKASLLKGKTVVTANKALLAHHGRELAELSEQNNASLCYEAAIAGGIPIVKTLREGLAANKLRRVYGILNGTCNFILSTMEETGRSFEDVLHEAQKNGYAEAEPSLDVDGGDTAHKLCLLASLAFGIRPDLKSLSSIRGIREITAQDIKAADELGYRIKLLGQADTLADGRIVQLVEPCLIPKTSSLANTHGVLNAVYTEGNFVGSNFVEGRGAGEGPTASAVVADIIDIMRGHRLPLFGVLANDLIEVNSMDAEEKTGEFYIRLVVLDQPGVIADVAAILRDYNISIESLIQRGRDPGQPVYIVLTTHDAIRGDLNRAAEQIAQLKSVTAKPLILERLSL